MFEVILSTRTTGRVVRKYFGTRDEAQDYADDWLAKKLTPRAGRRAPSGRNYSVEVQFVEVELPAEEEVIRAKRERLAA